MAEAIEQVASTKHTEVLSRTAYEVMQMRNSKFRPFWDELTEAEQDNWRTVVLAILKMHEGYHGK